MTIDPNPYVSPRTPIQSAASSGNLRRVLIWTFSIGGIIMLLVMLLLPARRTAGEAARRMQCGNHLKQIALALKIYEENYGSLPPAYTTDEQGRPLHSWRTLILPYLEQKVLYEKIDLSKPWDDPANKVAFETPIYTYQCPSITIPKQHTTYLAVVAPGGCFLPTQPRKLVDITDSPRLTLMVIEVEAERAVHWMSPEDASEEWLLSLGSVTELPHPRMVQAVCVDGFTIPISARSKPEVLRALISIAGNDDAIVEQAY